MVVELFQSQGCSTCPPADANLARIADRPDVIALSYAVTYWDHLGWKDTFAQPKFTLRQYEYAQSLRHPNVFTPQVVVDGRKDGSGIDRTEFLRLVGGAPPAPPGKTLPHRNIVRDLVRIGRWSGAAETLPLPPPADPAWKTAILVQAPKAGPIVAAAKD